MNHRHKRTFKTEQPRVVGVGPELPDEGEVYDKAVAAWRKTERLVQRQEAQRITFRRGPICIVYAADLHLGNAGVDYPRVFDEAEIVAKTPGMYLFLLGDLLDNFIIPKLMHARHRATVTVEEEWVLVRKYLRVVADKLLVSVGGNHEKFTWMLSAVDYFADVLTQIKRDAIYDTDQAQVLLEVGAARFPHRLRHLWQGTSIYNATHGQERAALFDGGFSVGVGAHIHRAGLIRAFNNKGTNAMAVLCGSYKRVDAYARTKGFARPNDSTAQSIIFFENGDMVGVENVARAADLMRRLRK
jgi:hypothetical protein